MKIRYLDFARYHGKGNTGSTQLRVHNLIKYWDEADLYKYGEQVDVMIFQKVYMQADFKLHAHLKCIKILDICDPDWLDRQNIVETVNNVDGVTVPTRDMQEFIQQLTDKPVLVVPDRHDIDVVLPVKKHTGNAKRFVWFGYKQNVDVLKSALRYLERMEYSLTIISNDDPQADRWCDKPGNLDYKFIKYDEDTFYTDMQEFDLCILPQGVRPVDRFKSNNKTTKAWLCGLPVVQTAEDIEALQDQKARQAEATRCYNKAIKEYDVKLSVKEMQKFIQGLKNG